MLNENYTVTTIGQTGERVWLYVQEVSGFFKKHRRWVAWILIAVYFGIPWIKIGGEPLLQLDIINRQFTVLGTHFWPSDVRIILPAFIAFVVTFTLVTALFGRIWCGWACPQTVFLEFVFEPIERLFEGKALLRKSRDKKKKTPWWVARKAGKHATFLLFAFLVSNTFLAYIWGIEQSLKAISHPPAQNMSAFLFMLAVSGVFYFIFAWFKEQACVIVCPYARLQSALVDRDTMIISYDEKRGEPRGKKDETTGDCIDCGYCVRVCPTGIDIRNGQQLECIGCAHCIDACNHVMRSIKKPEGLIRYSTFNALAGKPFRLLRPRVVLYAALVGLLFAGFGFALANRSLLQVDLVRSGTSPYVVIADSMIQNVFALKILNKDRENHQYQVAFADIPDAIHNLGSSLDAPSGIRVSVPLIVNVPRSVFRSGIRHTTLTLTDEAHRTFNVETNLVGPLR